MSEHSGRTVRTKQAVYTDAGEIPMGTVLQNVRQTEVFEMVEAIWNGVPVWISKSQVEPIA